MSLSRSHLARLLAASLALASFGGRAVAADPGITDDEIVIGLFGPLSGPIAAFGTDTLNAARMIYEQKNKEGGINGRKVRLVIEDDKCNPTETNAVALKLVTVDKVFMLHGGSCTAAAVSIQSYVTREKIPHQMLNASGDPAIFPPTRYVFGGFGGTQRGIGYAIMKFATDKLGGKRIAYITSDDDFGTANYAAAKAVADQAGATMVAYERIPNTIVDVTSTMLRVRQSNPDVIVSAAYPQGAVLIAQARLTYGLTQPTVFAAQGVASPEVFAKNVGDNAALKDFYYSSAAADTPNSERLKPTYDMYKAAYPERTQINSLMVMGIPSAKAVISGLEKAGRDLTREKFIDAMETVSFDSQEVAGPIAFGKDRRDSLRGQIIIKFDGSKTDVVGRYEWDGKTAQ